MLGENSEEMTKVQLLSKAPWGVKMEKRIKNWPE